MNDLIDNNSVMMTKLIIREVRHLKGISLSLCDNDEAQRKHLLITGKNSSGKTGFVPTYLVCYEKMKQLRRYKKPFCRFCTDKFIKILENNENPSVHLNKITISYRR